MGWACRPDADLAGGVRDDGGIAEGAVGGELGHGVGCAGAIELDVPGVGVGGGDAGGNAGGEDGVSLGVGREIAGEGVVAPAKG